MKYKILFIDIVSMPEHKVYNKGILRALCRNNIIDVCASDKYIDREEFQYGSYYSIPDKFVFAVNKPKEHIQFEYRKRTYLAYRWIKKNVPLEKYDIIWFSYTEPITFWLAFNRCKIPVIYCDHLISEMITNKVKKWFFRHINPDYRFIYFEEYIGRYLSESIKMRNPMYLVRHPLPVLNVKTISLSNIIFAPSNSNDEQFVDHLIENEACISENLKIVIRSKTKEYQSEKLAVYNHRLPDEEYYTVMAASRAVLIHYGPDYNYRTSAVWFESLLAGRLCYMYCGNTMREYADKYPDIIRPFYSNHSFFEVISNWESDTGFCTYERFDNALKDYSDQAILKQVEKVICEAAVNEK